MYKRGKHYISGVALTPQDLADVEKLAAYYNISRSAAIRMMIKYVSDTLDDVTSPNILFRGYLDD